MKEIVMRKDVKMIRTVMVSVIRISMKKRSTS